MSHKFLINTPEYHLFTKYKQPKGFKNNTFKKMKDYNYENGMGNKYSIFIKAEVFTIVKISAFIMVSKESW